MGKGQGRSRKRDRKMKVLDSTVAAYRGSAHGYTAWEQDNCSLQSSRTWVHSMAAAQFQLTEVPHTGTQYDSRTIAV